MLETQSQIRFKNILFTTDFSKAAEAALPFAAKMAHSFGAQLWALHVNPPAINPMTPPITWRQDESAAEIRKSEQKASLHDATRGMNAKIVIEEGELSRVLEDIYRDNNIDLVVMGTRGRSGVVRLALGSTAEEIFRKVSCPVMMVGPHVTSPAGERRVFSNILFATSLESKTALPYVISMAREFVADLTLVHVIKPLKACELVQVSDVEDACIRQLQAMLPAEAQQWGEPRFLIRHGEPADEILAVAERQKADLIVLGVHEEQGVPGASTHLPISVAHKVIAQANCPVLTVRD